MDPLRCVFSGLMEHLHTFSDSRGNSVTPIKGVPNAKGDFCFSLKTKKRANHSFVRILVPPNSISFLRFKSFQWRSSLLRRVLSDAQGSASTRCLDVPQPRGSTSSPNRKDRDSATSDADTQAGAAFQRWHTDSHPVGLVCLEGLHLNSIQQKSADCFFSHGHWVSGFSFTVQVSALLNLWEGGFLGKQLLLASHSPWDSVRIWVCATGAPPKWFPVATSGCRTSLPESLCPRILLGCDWPRDMGAFLDHPTIEP